MLLLIDAGNTRIKWAAAADGAAAGSWLADGAVAHSDIATLGASWHAAGVAPGGARVLMSNVAGAAVAAALAAQLAALAQLAGLAKSAGLARPTAAPAAIELFRAGPQCAGVRNGYRDPAQLGSDRFAAAIGARTLAPGQALIVATCGTATTVDALDAGGLFIGGMILPGLGLMASALARNTAQLPQLAERAPATLPAGFADNTDDAILAGCIGAQAGAIERACALLPAELCLLSGGAARYVAPALRVPLRLVDNIVLLGLHAAALAKE